MTWALTYVKAWLSVAGITEGAVFRGFYKGGKVRDTRLSVRGIIDIVSRYTVNIDGDERRVQIHDLRRSYAKNLYLDGMPIEEIRQNMGHANVRTTQGYIGTLDASTRAPKAVYTPPSSVNDLQRRWMIDAG
jgi:integrase